MNTPPLSFDSLLEHLTKEWNETTLAAFHEDAKKQTSGISIRSIMPSKGKRIVLLMCIAIPDKIEALGKIIGLDHSECRNPDWSTTPLSIMFRDNFGSKIIQHEVLRDHMDKPVGLFLIAGDPISIEKLSKIFTLPT